MNKMKCYKVKCQDSNMNMYVVGVMTTDEYAAKHCAVHSLLEGRHIKTCAIDAVEVDKI